MSASDLAKIGLVDFFSEEGIETSKSDWKRTAKINADGDIVRRFENSKVGIVSLISAERLDEYEGEGDSLFCHEAGELLISVGPGDGAFGMNYSLMVVAKTFWDRNEHFPDQHWGWILNAAYDFPEGLLGDEVMENTFVPSAKYQKMSKDELVALINTIPSVSHLDYAEV